MEFGSWNLEFIIPLKRVYKITIMKNFSDSKFNFEDLFIFEMANNHQGSPEHGLKIISAMADIADRHSIRGAVKLQFRELDTFIHPDHRENKDNKHIVRFLSTRLNENEFSRLIDKTKNNGLVSIVTPFDEPSVDLIKKLGVEVIKVASSSAHDWTLLEKISEAGKPVICSTGGLSISDIDKVVSFFQHRGVDFALMHCVSVYPTPNNKLYLNQIEILKNRYPAVMVGFSTHEEPTNLSAVRVAYAKGARIFEKHVGIPTDKITLNSYSATPEETEAWVKACLEARDACGAGEKIVSDKEKSDLYSLMRGVYAKKDIPAGAVLAKSDVFFAMPIADGQLPSGLWKDGIVADRNYKTGEALFAIMCPPIQTKKDIIYSAIHHVKGMLNNARIPLGHDFSVELSHHYGLDKFHEIGCVIIECINREYAKKLIVQLAGQWNPTHYHKKKDETFQVLHGSMEAEIEERKKVLHPGDSLWVPRGVWHSFRTDTGVIFEEISTTSFGDDSFYVDKELAKRPRDERKTRLHNWGRHQFDDLDDNIGDQNVLV